MPNGGHDTWMTATLAGEDPPGSPSCAHTSDEEVVTEIKTIYGNCIRQADALRIAAYMTGRNLWGPFDTLNVDTKEAICAYLIPARYKKWVRDCQ